MSVTVTNNFGAFERRFKDAVDAGLIAAAQVVINQAKRNVRGSVFAVPESPRHHVTGNLMNSITRSEPSTEDGVRVIRVGTNVSYGLYWEVGWQPHMTKAGPRRLLRHPWLLPAAMDTRQEQAAAFARAAGAVLAASAERASRAEEIPGHAEAAD